jgi:hypothetical protein
MHGQCATTVSEHAPEQDGAGTVGTGLPMLDPNWTPARGYSHSLALLRQIQRREG